MEIRPRNAIVTSLCLLFLAVFVESSVTTQRGSSSRETLISGVCEGVSSSEYQSYVNYNLGKTYVFSKPCTMCSIQRGCSLI